MWKVIAYRPVQAGVIAILAALVTACAVATPLFERALEQTSVDVLLEQAPDGSSDLRIASSGVVSTAFSRRGQDIDALEPEELADLVPAAVRRSFAAPVAALSIGVTSPRGDPQPSRGPLVWREGACGHLRFDSGRCPRDTREIAVSTADAETFGWSVGSTVRADETQPTEAEDLPVSTTLTVVGVYHPPNDGFWRGWVLTGISGTTNDRGDVLHDTWITDRASFGADPGWRNPSSQVDLGLDRAGIGIDEFLRLGPAVTALQRSPAARPPGSAPVDVLSAIPSLVDTVRTGRDQARVTVPALVVPLGVLGLVVLWMALGAAAEQRRPELAVARLRGRGVRGARTHVLRELLTIVLLGVPAGVVAAVVVASLARSWLLPGEVSLELRPAVLAAVLLAVLAVTGAAALVSTQISREPIVALLRRVPPRRTGWRLGAVDAFIVTVAASILGAFVTGQLTGPVALVAPAVMALALGLVLARVIAVLATRAGRRLVGRGSTSGGVALLQLARRPGTRAIVALLTVSAAVAVFAGDAVVVGARTRDVAAAQQVGAPMVATVSGGSVHGLRQALGSAGTGTPVVVQRALSDEDQTVLYVDPAEFARIATFPDRTKARRALDRLSVVTPPPVEVAGTRLTLQVDAGDFYEGSGQPVELVVELLRHDGVPAPVSLGGLPESGSRTRTVDVSIDCAGGCVLTGWRVVTDPTSVGEGRIRVGSLRTDRAGPVALGAPDDWRPTNTEGGSMRALSSNRTSLEIFVVNRSAAELQLPHGWVPESLPATVSGALPPGSKGQEFNAAGLDGTVRPRTADARLAWLPAAGRHAAISDLSLAERAGAVLDDDALLQVWFADEDSRALSRVRRAVEQRDMSLTHVARTSDARRLLDESPATWSLRLGGLVGVACLVVALLGLAVAGAASWRSRARDLATLRLHGMDSGVVRGISLTEQAATTVVPVLAGSAAGILAARFALPELSLLPTSPQVDLVDLSTAWPEVLALTSAMLLALCCTGLVVAWLIARRARLELVVESG